MELILAISAGKKSPGKTAHGPVMRDDEDKGSPSRDGANPGDFRREKIDRSAEALRVCHHPFNLSLRK